MSSLRRKGQIGGFAIAGAVFAAILFGAYDIQQIRMGGSLHKVEREITDFNADIMPPSQFVVEPFMEATLLIDEPQTLKERRAELAELKAAYADGQARWRASNLDPQLKSEHQRASQSADAFWRELEQSFLPAADRGDTEAMDRSHTRMTEIYTEHRDAIHALAKRAAEVHARVVADAEASLFWMIGLLGLLVTGIFGMLLYSVRYLMRNAIDPLAETAQIMGAMAGGNLEAGVRTVHRDDEIGEMTRTLEVFRASAIAQRDAEAKQRFVVETLSSALDELAEGNLTHRIATPLAAEYETLRSTFNGSVERLAELLRRVTQSASGVSTGAAEIRAASDDLALRNEQQAASLEETAAAMNQVTGIVRDSARNAAEVQRSITEAHREATDGGAVVRSAIEAMDAIEKSAEEITQIINVIDGIAFQTNLLALNAGVEAARAGDAGKGFAVVANEVRALAQRSADAAKDIKELITASTQQVGGGVTLVGQTGELLEKIVGRVGEISERVTEIARSAESQSVNLEQVNAAVSEMDRMTQQNAAMVEQSTAAARSLAEESRELTSLVGQFNTGAERMSADPVPFPASAARRKAAAPAPVVQGNLAVSLDASDEDWTEF